ncbi:MAG: sugar phosphate isomerase/epimerase family protein [Alphaproteobacteria bacterium]
MAVREAGVTSVGVTRDTLREMGVAELSRCLNEHGLTVSSLCSAGFFTDASSNPREPGNFEMIDAAAELGADVLCVICGGAGDPPMPLAQAHDLIEAGFSRLAARAKARGVTLGLEPIHPADILNKGCINSIAHGLKIIEPHPDARLILDVIHSWWDPDFPRLLHQAPEQVALVQVSNVRLENGLPAGRDTLVLGALDMPRLLRQVLPGAYRGTFEFELFASDVRGRDVRQLIAAFPGEFAD